jgi:hypothetical protein
MCARRAGVIVGGAVPLRRPILLTAANLGNVLIVRDSITWVAVALPTIMGVLSMMVGAYIFGTTTAMVMHGWSAIPHWDQWSELIFSLKQVFSPWLYSQHNEHRIIFPRLLFAIDTFAFAETNKFNFFCNVALPLTLAGLIILIAHRHVSRSIPETLWIAGVVLTALFSAMQCANFLWGFQVQFFGVELAAVASIACLVLGGRRYLSLVGAIGFSAVAVYSLASGILVPFLAIPMALWARRPKAQIGVLGAAAVALLASYLHGYVSPPYHSDPLKSLLHLDIPVYVALELGNPFGQLFREFHLEHYLWWDGAFGALGLVFFVAVALIHWRRGRPIGADPELLFLGITGLMIGTALLTALGRLEFGVEQAITERYATPMSLFWLSLAMLAIIEIWRHSPDLRLLAMSLGLLCLIGLASAQSAFIKTGLAWVLPRRDATTALLADVDDVDALVRIFPDTKVVEEEAVKLRVEHLAIFADGWSIWLGTPLADHIHLGDPTQCRGGLDEIKPLPVSGRRPQWRVSGWAWDDARRTAPGRIVLADRTGRVIGYALGGYPSKLGGAGRKDSGWRGHFAAEEASPVTAYALLNGGHMACALTHGSGALTPHREGAAPTPR